MLYLYVNANAMDVELKKKEIKAAIETIEDEKLLWAIARLLHLDDESDVPDWHKQIVMEQVEKYEKGIEKALDWDEVKKEL